MPAGRKSPALAIVSENLIYLPFITNMLPVKRSFVLYYTYLLINIMCISYTNIHK